jgi:predicted unusual protein kinase regulating ubiquinone biosynthesis (AarF/ABC1/UbiB family)
VSAKTGRRVAAIGLGGMAAAGAAVAVAARRKRGAAAGSPVHHHTTFRRNLSLARVGARTGGDFAVHRARRTFASAARREELDRAFELRTAEQVAETLGQMKGALMKVGQMVSYLDQGLPEHVRAALANLQQDAPPMSPELAAGVVRAELGDEPERVFLEWDPVPIASASIGQVHRAITRDGRAVAVKVQYPGVDEAMSADLNNLGFLFAGMAQLFPGLDPGPIAEELRTRLAEELDYTREAENQAAFARHYEGHPTIHVPAVVAALSTKRVLTTELAEGVGWAEMLTWSPAERNLAAETLYRFAFGSLYRLGMFNGDPHPGNYLFRPGGKVTFLDFGLVRHFTDAELKPFQDLIDAMVQHPDPERFRHIIEDAGLLRSGEEFTTAEIMDYFSHFYEFILIDGPYTITAAYASETVRRYFDQRGPHGRILKATNLPASWVVIQRINLGLYALFGELEATGNWRRLAEELWPWVCGPPSTPMGEAIAKWEAERARTT